MSEKYLTMHEASKLCSYDQEYLSLLARRGQLQATKIGKKWFTTVEWMNEYLKEKKPNDLIEYSDNQKEVETDKIIIKKENYQKIWWISIIVGVGLILSVLISYQLISNKLSQLEERTSKNRQIGVEESSNQQSGWFFKIFESEKLEF
jgi:hypothetical protein